MLIIDEALYSSLKWNVWLVLIILTLFIINTIADAPLAGLVLSWFIISSCMFVTTDREKEALHHIVTQCIAEWKMSKTELAIHLYGQMNMNELLAIYGEALSTERFVINSIVKHPTVNEDDQWLFLITWDLNQSLRSDCNETEQCKYKICIA